MELTNRFEVDVPIERAWAILTDVEQIAPCLPGAELQEFDGERYRGVVKLKVGPITAQYRGEATFLELDADERRAVLRAEGTDTRGQGRANATITASMRPAGAGTAVTVVTDLAVTGRVAQFGRGVLADVSERLLGQFVACLETTVLAAAPVAEEGPVPAGPEAEGADTLQPPSVVRPADRVPAEPVQLLTVVGQSGARRVWALLALVLAVLVLRRALVRR